MGSLLQIIIVDLQCERSSFREIVIRSYSQNLGKLEEVDIGDSKIERGRRSTGRIKKGS